MMNPLRYVIQCPECGHELFWYATSNDGSKTFKCINCKTYYLKKNGRHTELKLTDVPNQYNKLYFNHDVVQSKYNGVPTSIACKPKWLRIIEKIIRIKR
ncbi:hypothetical protein D3C76_581890 [compost metagenome]|uniref:Transposase-like protein n=1 Tax=Fontibacillus solani TaxID=1572857 RepID=A0A7W3SYX3_9BACL|nr:transposase-like protein [Fontibacillus solani]